MTKYTRAQRGALKAHRNGLSIIALKPNSKVPAEKGWKEKAFKSGKALKGYFRTHPDANFGVLTGDGYVVVDPDGKIGKLAFKHLEREHEPLSDTVTVITPGGGLHLYYRYDGGDIGNSVGKLGPHIDVRGAGGFVVCAGSVHPNGGVYRYAKGRGLGEIPIAPLPQWPAKKLAKSTQLLPAPARVRPLRGKDAVRARKYAERALELEIERVSKAPLHQRNDTLNRASFKLGQLISHGLLDRDAVTAKLAAAGRVCGLSASEIEPTVKSGLEAGMLHPRRLPTENSDDADTDPIESPRTRLTAELARLGETDTDNAARFVRRFGHQVMWTPGMGWHVYGGACWVPDVGNIRLQLAKRVVKRIRKEVKFLTGSKERDSRRKFAERSLGKGDIDRMLALAQPDLMVNDDQLDSNPFLLSVANGTLDLKAGLLLPHDPRDLITRTITVRYNPGATSRLFKSFINHVTGGNKNFARFLKKIAGYTLTGSTREQLLFFLYGPPDTGKTTLINLLSDLLGPYAVNTPMKTFLVKRFDNEIPVDEARMKGARMVTAIENNVNQQLDEAKIKAMTGNDKMTARFMRQNPFDFRPEFKIWLGANDMPRVRATDDAIWTRFVVLPFSSQLKDSDQDKDLPKKLNGEMEAVLAWAVRGAKLWAKEGLEDKAMFDYAKGSWRKQSDTVGRFFHECCQLADATQKVQSSVLYGRYKQWCTDAGEQPSTTTEFKARLIELNVAPKKDRNAHWWLGVKLIK